MRIIAPGDGSPSGGGRGRNRKIRRSGRDERRRQAIRSFSERGAFVPTSHPSDLLTFLFHSPVPREGGRYAVPGPPSVRVRSAAWAAARRAIGTRKGLQLT